MVSSYRFLGGVLGDISARDEFVSCKVCQWVSNVTHLTQLAVPQPQAAFATLIRCLQGEWVYLQHVIPGCGSLFSDLTNILRTQFCLHCLDIKSLHLSISCFCYP